MCHQAPCHGDAHGDNFLLSCKGQRWGKSAANGILLPKRMFPQCVYLLPHVFVSLKSKIVPQQIWALSVQQGCPSNTHRRTSVQQLPCTWTQPPPCPIMCTPCLPPLTPGCSAPSLKVTVLLETLCSVASLIDTEWAPLWLGDKPCFASSMEGSKEQKAIPGFLLSLCTKKMRAKSHRNSLVFLRTLCSRWLASHFIWRLI